MISKEKKNSLNNQLNRKLVQIILQNSQWYDYFNSMRNLITHWGNLLDFKSTLHKAAIDQEFARIYYPQMPDGKKVTKYMNETWINLSGLINSMGKVLMEIYLNETEKEDQAYDC